MLDFNVKSSINNYQVKFIDDTLKTLQNELCDGDVLIIDNSIINNYPDLNRGLNNFKKIIIDANEKNKSYEGINKGVFNHEISNP